MTVSKDVRHYNKIIKALVETDKIMEKICKHIDKTFQVIEVFV